MNTPRRTSRPRPNQTQGRRPRDGPATIPVALTLLGTLAAYILWTTLLIVLSHKGMNDRAAFAAGALGAIAISAACVMALLHHSQPQPARQEPAGEETPDTAAGASHQRHPSPQPDTAPGRRNPAVPTPPAPGRDRTRQPTYREVLAQRQQENRANTPPDPQSTPGQGEQE